MYSLNLASQLNENVLACTRQKWRANVKNMSVLKVLWDVISTFLFGIGLPSGDVGTDINLGVRLILNGHPKWAMCVLAPVFTNMFFTFFACARIEKKKCWWYFPLVLLQIYPQFCAARILFRWWRGRNNYDREAFIKERDDIDGGLGCVESYLEAVPQAFIQTAFFTIANNLTSTVSRLCYNEKAKSCAMFDTSDCLMWKECSKYGNNYCDPIGIYPYHYKNATQLAECEKEIQNCTEMYEFCIKPFHACLSNCTENLTSEISRINEQELFRSYVLDDSNHLSEQYGASMADLKSIQLYLLFIGDKAVFLSTYAISIIAAAYGVSKFFRLSYSRHCDKFTTSGYHDDKLTNDGVNPVTFVITFVITCVYLVAKGFALASFMELNENEMHHNVLLWLLFCILPSFAFALIIMFGRTFYKTKTKSFCGSYLYNNYSISILLKEPSVIGVPIVTPFIYSTNTSECTRTEEFDKNVHYEIVSKIGCFEINYPLSFLNNLLAFSVGTAGLILKSKWKMEIMLPLAAFLLTCTTCMLYAVKIFDAGSSRRCFKHGRIKSLCTVCIMEYGLYIGDYEKRKVCSAHKNVLPCQYCSK